MKTEELIADELAFYDIARQLETDLSEARECLQEFADWYDSYFVGHKGPAYYQLNKARAILAKK